VAKRWRGARYRGFLLSFVFLQGKKRGKRETCERGKRDAVRARGKEGGGAHAVEVGAGKGRERWRTTAERGKKSSRSPRGGRRQKVVYRFGWARPGRKKERGRDWATGKKKGEGEGMGQERGRSPGKVRLGFCFSFSVFLSLFI
jgi:hypothetical protein